MIRGGGICNVQHGTASISTEGVLAANALTFARHLRGGDTGAANADGGGSEHGIEGNEKNCGVWYPTEAAVQYSDISSGRDLVGGATTKRKLMG